MEYKVVVGHPPNFDKIKEVFPLATRAHVVFAYHDTIYVSGMMYLSEALIDHECVHLERQQAMGVEAWWDKYLTDLEFRYSEELLAHKAEYKTMTRKMKPGAAKPIAMLISRKLTAPLYRFNRTIGEAFSDIIAGSMTKSKIRSESNG